VLVCVFFFQAEDGIRDWSVTGVQTCALPISSGAMIFEETPALSIDPAGVRKRVTTAAGRVRAPHVVLAGNAHLGMLAPSLAETEIGRASCRERGERVVGAGSCEK